MEDVEITSPHVGEECSRSGLSQSAGLFCLAVFDTVLPSCFVAVCKCSFSFLLCLQCVL